MTDQPPPPPAVPPGFGPPPPQYAPRAVAPQAFPAQQGPPPYASPPYASPPYAAQPHAPQPGPGGAGPGFLAVDKRNSVVVDASGVAFEMYDITVDFPWAEIRSVHYRARPDGRALMVAVVHLDGRVYECVVTAKPKERLQGWFAQLAWVLGHYRPTG
ncbi:hypothetical protein [Streptomyces hilarionis]|uniref:hypothetical protein n=1 Tax=Streptomyces hilarionis TaxID=2839954 RepID=UPI00211A8887|nr:hypothetical protein [Streptomyces hilarionis]MCQ9133883.1 hypothetical protein [Streptomyces hilarionis]